MEERNAELLRQYELNINRISRVRGVLLLETDQGLKLFGACQTSERRAEFEQCIKEGLAENGFYHTDRFVRTKEGTLQVTGAYGEQFMMRDWFFGEECDVRNYEQVLLAVRTLARLHQCFAPIGLPEAEKIICTQTRIPELLERRNRELRRVRAYIREKKQKNAFEGMYLSLFPTFYRQAEEALSLLSRGEYEEYYQSELRKGQVVHGNYTHHSVWMLPQGGTAVVHFEKACIGIRIQDFYLFFRKLMEKNSWDAELGAKMLRAYEEVREIPGEEKRLLQVLLWYPEKFWKIANHYYNNRKSWVPQKNIQKLMITMEQIEKKQDCLQKLFAL